jgi:hypothetical protein
MDNDDNGGLQEVIGYVKASGQMSEWWDNQPKSTPKQQQVLHLFYQLSQERQRESVIKERDIHEMIASKGAPYPNDLMVDIIRALDRHYLEERNRRTKAKMRNQHG